MGVLNVTPDSFSDGGRYQHVDKAMDRIHRMLSDGASIIDIGGESTRPNAEPVSLDDELSRVLPVIEKAKEHFPSAIISIDTTKYEVAKESLDLGVQIVNDVSGLVKEPRLAEISAKYNAAYVLMHSQGDPKTMQKNPTYDQVVQDIDSFFEQKIRVLQEAGVNDIILDPGIGFGKKLEHNLKLIASLDSFTKKPFPVLIGASRKSMIGQILDGRPPEERLTGTIAVHYHALMKGAKILRVHDVKEASDSIRIFNAIQSQA
jgi:dihydropteroate synthase